MMKSRFPRKQYGQRWQIEATYSQDKRRFGSQIAASSTMGQYYEVLLRVLVHNVAIVLRIERVFNGAIATPFVEEFSV